MSTYTIGAGAAARRLNLKPLGRRGAAGTIYRDLDASAVVVKIYNSEEIAAKQRRKLAAMLARPPLLPPLTVGGKTYTQIAWPIDAVSEGGRVVGFTMPEIDFKASVELEALLHRVTREADGLPEAYGFRLTVARNLAAVFAALHGQGHYVIDAKPVNLRAFRETGFVAVLDCDGFHISGGAGEHFPAGQYTDGYIAPEALDQPPQALGREQDQFALAVMLFQLLNNGIHPYQGRPKNDGVPADLAGCIRARSYPYGRVEDSRQAPAASSLHRWFEEETLALFERAFLGLTRPTAGEWQQHLEALSRSARTCTREPLTHRHFSKGCGLCALEAGRARAPTVANRVPPVRAREPVWGQNWGAGGTIRRPAPPPLSTIVSSPPAPARASRSQQWKDFSLLILVPVIIIVALLGVFIDRSTGGYNRRPTPPFANPTPNEIRGRLIASYCVGGGVDCVRGAIEMQMTGNRVFILAWVAGLSHRTAVSVHDLSGGLDLTCRLVGSGPRGYACTHPNGLDLGLSAIRLGLAGAGASAPPHYIDAENEARRQRRGYYSSPPAPAPTSPQPARFSHVSGTLAATECEAPTGNCAGGRIVARLSGGQAVALAHVLAFDRDSARAINVIVSDRAIACDATDVAVQEFLCRAGRQGDIGLIAVRAGLARARVGAPANYPPAESEARRERRGYHSTPPASPPTPPQPPRFSQVGGTLAAIECETPQGNCVGGRIVVRLTSGQVAALAHVMAFDRDSARAIERIVSDRAVVCDITDVWTQEFFCRAGRQGEIGLMAIQAGLARARVGAPPHYSRAEEEALRAGRGFHAPPGARPDEGPSGARGPSAKP